MKKWNPMNVFSYCMIGVGFAAISVAIGMYINLGMTEILKNFVVWMIGGAIIGLLSLIYETEQLSNVKATLIHAPLTCLTALIVAGFAATESIRFLCSSSACFRPSQSFTWSSMRFYTCCTAHPCAASIKNSTNKFFLGQTPTVRFPLILRTEVRCMVCCWRVFGLAAAAFGLGLLLAQLLPCLPAAAHRNGFAHCCRHCRTLERLKGVCLMKVVVIKSPKLLAGILRGIFGIKNTSAV